MSLSVSHEYCEEHKTKMEWDHIENLYICQGCIDDHDNK